MRSEAGVIRFEFLILGVVLSALGGITFLVPNLLSLQGLGGVILGAGLTVVMTELYSTSERVRHRRLLEEVIEVRKQNTELLTMNEQATREIRGIRTQANSIVIDRKQAELKTLRQAFEIGKMLGKLYWRTPKENLDATRDSLAVLYYATVDSLEITEAAKRAWSWIAEQGGVRAERGPLEPNSPESALSILAAALYLKHGKMVADFFFAGTCLQQMKGIWTGQIKVFDQSFNAGAVEKFLLNLGEIEQDAVVQEYAKRAFKELLLPNIPQRTKQALIGVFSTYFATFGSPTSEEFHAFFRSGLLPHDKEAFLEGCGKLSPDASSD